MSSKVLLEVCVERAEQDQKWGGPSHDDEHSPEDWLKFIEQHSRKVPFRAYDGWGNCDPVERAAAQATYRKQMIRIAALAVAAVESFDRKHPPTSCDPNDGKTIVQSVNTFERRNAIYSGPGPDTSPVGKDLGRCVSAKCEEMGGEPGKLVALVTDDGRWWEADACPRCHCSWWHQAPKEAPGPEVKRMTASEWAAAKGGG